MQVLTNINRTKKSGDSPPESKSPPEMLVPSIFQMTMANKINTMPQNTLKVSPRLKSDENSFIPSIPQVAKEDPLTSLRLFSNMLVANMNVKSLDEQDEAL